MKTYKNPSIVSGKSIQDILDMDIETFNKLSKADLQKVVGRLVSAGNKRLRVFDKLGKSSPATRWLEKKSDDKYFSTKGKNLNELRAEFARARNFLNSKTSSYRGYRQVLKDTVKTLKKEGVKIPVNKLEDMLKAYERLKELDPNVATRGMKYPVFTEISQNANVDIDVVVVETQKKLEDIYKKQIDAMGGANDGTSNYFNIGSNL